MCSLEVAGCCKGWKAKARRKMGVGTDLYTAQCSSGTQTCSIGATGLAPPVEIYDGIASSPVENGRSCTGTSMRWCLSSGPILATQTNCHRTACMSAVVSVCSLVG